MKRGLSKILLNILFILKEAYRNHRSYYIFAGLATVAYTMLSWLSVLFLKFLIDFLGVEQYRKALICVAVYGILFFCMTIFMKYFSMKRLLMEQSLENTLKLALAKKQMTMPYEDITYNETHNQYYFAKKSVEKGSIGKLMANLSAAFSSISTFIGVFFIAAFFNFWIFLALIAVIIVNIVGNVKRMQYSYKQSQEEIPVERSLYYARDYLTNPVFAKEVRAFGLKDYILSKIKNGIEALFSIELKTVKRYYKHFWWTYVVNGLQLALVYTYIGFLLFYGKVTAGEFSMCISAIFLFSAMLIRFANAVAGIVQNSKYIGNLKEFLELRPETGGHMPVTYFNDRFVPEQYKISFVDVSFRYDAQSPYALRHLNLEINSLERLCIVGQNGSGKTTLIKLLMGLYTPTEGKILLNGKDIREFDRLEYLALFSTVFQDFNIFSFSIAENIALNTSCDKEKIEHTLQLVGLDEKVNVLKKGIETDITERLSDDGINFSGGEQQLFAIARACYKDAPICILDEPTAALSPQNEYRLYKKFDQITKGKTVLYISHRLASCRLADKIAVLKAGELAEYGTHQQLLALNGHYAEMFLAQAEYYNSSQTSVEKGDEKTCQASKGHL